MDAFQIAQQEIEITSFIEKHTDLDLIRNGNIYFVSCPLDDNGDSNPSLAIYPNQNTFYCFHCDGSFYGNIIDFVRGYYKLNSNMEALNKLSSLYPEIRFGISNYKSQSNVRSKFISNMKYQTSTSISNFDNSDFEKALIKVRNLTKENMRVFGLGVREENGFPRLTFPNYDKDNNVLAITTRQLVEGDPKAHYYMVNVYLDPVTGEYTTKNNENRIVVWEKSKWLYNLNKAMIDSKNGRVFIVEGHLDVVAAAEYGLQAVATGWKVIKEDQAKLLEPFNEIVLCPDGDAITDVPKAYSVLRKLYPKKVIKILLFDNKVVGKDFGDFRKAYPEKSGEDIVKSLQFFEEFLVKNFNYSEIVDLLRIMNEPIGRTLAVKNLADQFGIDQMLLNSTIGI